MTKGVLHTDGACFGNPGPMGLGIVLEYGDQKITESIPHGMGTNNIAEYSALIKGMELALEHGVTELFAYADAALLVHQINDRWSVKNPELQKLYERVKELKSKFEWFSIAHIGRIGNFETDALSKAAAQRVTNKAE